MSRLLALLVDQHSMLHYQCVYVCVFVWHLVVFGSLTGFQRRVKSFMSPDKVTADECFLLISEINILKELIFLCSCAANPLIFCRVECF